MGMPRRSPVAIVEDSAGLFHSEGKLPESVTGPGIGGAVLDAARRCMLLYGSGKTNMNDVARIAGVSRASIYNNYADRDELINSVSLLGRKMYFQDIAAAMEGGTSLEQRIGRAAIVTERWRAAIRSRRWGGVHDDDAAAVLLTIESAEPLKQLETLIQPYIVEAANSVEVRPDLDNDQAAEWIARVLISLIAHPPSTFDEDDDASVASFIMSFCVRGLR